MIERDIVDKEIDKERSKRLRETKIEFDKNSKRESRESK